MIDILLEVILDSCTVGQCFFGPFRRCEGFSPVAQQEHESCCGISYTSYNVCSAFHLELNRPVHKGVGPVSDINIQDVRRNSTSPRHPGTVVLVFAPRWPPFGSSPPFFKGGQRVWNKETSFLSNTPRIEVGRVEKVPDLSVGRRKGVGVPMLIRYTPVNDQYSRVVSALTGCGS